MTQKNDVISANYLNETFSYYTTTLAANTEDSAFEITNPLAYTSGNAAVYARVENSDGCFSVTQINLVVSVTQIPANFVIPNQYLCDDYLDAINDDYDGISGPYNFTGIQNNLAALSKQYSENHPVIQNLIQRRETVSSWLQEFTVKNDGDNLEITFGMTPDRLINEQLSSKFYTKYHDFNIALDIEKKSLESYIGLIKMPQLPTAPIWPKKRLFASLGLIMGLVISFIVVFMNEVLLPSRDEKLAQEAKLLETMVLGSLPKIPGNPSHPQSTNTDQRESVGV